MLNRPSGKTLKKKNDTIQTTNASTDDGDPGIIPEYSISSLESTIADLNINFKNNPNDITTAIMLCDAYLIKAHLLIANYKSYTPNQVNNEIDICLRCAKEIYGIINNNIVHKNDINILSERIVYFNTKHRTLNKRIAGSNAILRKLKPLSVYTPSKSDPEKAPTSVLSLNEKLDLLKSNIKYAKTEDLISDLVQFIRKGLRTLGGDWSLSISLDEGEKLVSERFQSLEMNKTNKATASYTLLSLMIIDELKNRNHLPDFDEMKAMQSKFYPTMETHKRKACEIKDGQAVFVPNEYVDVYNPTFYMSLINNSGNYFTKAMSLKPDFQEFILFTNSDRNYEINLANMEIEPTIDLLRTTTPPILIRYKQSYYIYGITPDNTTTLTQFKDPMTIVKLRDFFVEHEENVVNRFDGYKLHAMNIEGELTLEHIEKLKLEQLEKHDITGYDLTLMSSLPENNKDKAENNKIYLSTDGKFVIRDRNGIIQTGQLNIKSFDLSDLKSKLKNQKFKSRILAAITDQTLTTAPVVIKNNNSYYLYGKTPYGIYQLIKLNSKSLNQIDFPPGIDSTDYDELYNEIINLKAHPVLDPDQLDNKAIKLHKSRHPEIYQAIEENGHADYERFDLKFVTPEVLEKPSLPPRKSRPSVVSQSIFNPVSILNKPVPILMNTRDKSKKWGLSMMLGATIVCRLLPGGLSENTAKQAKDLAYIDLNENGINIYFIADQNDYSKNLYDALSKSDAFKPDQPISLTACNIDHYTTCLTIPGHNNVASFIQNICGYSKKFVDALYRARSNALLLNQVKNVMIDRLKLAINNSKKGIADTLILSWPEGKSITIKDGANVIDIRVPTTFANIWKAIQKSNIEAIKKYISEAPLEATYWRKQSTVDFYKSLQLIKSRIETNMLPPKPSLDIRKAPM